MRICLVSSGQPSSNPRLVKEADALVDAGYDVHVIAAYWADWATDADAQLCANRAWSYTFVDWRRATGPLLFWWSRVRFRMARALAARSLLPPSRLRAAAGRVTPELTYAALGTHADLYIAHNLGALPAAAIAAMHHDARLGFDAEDFHSGQFGPRDDPREQRLAAGIEAAYIPQCDYVTAAAPGIADAYRVHRREPPTCVLNVFPLADRAEHKRPTHTAGPVTLYWFSQTIGPGRGLEDVVRAMGRFADGEIELHLRGTWQAGFETTLRAIASASGVAEKRVVAHPAAPPAEMVRCAAAYDVGLAVETGETVNSDILLSNKIFTYLLAGSAVLATRTTGQRPIIEALGPAAAGYNPGDIDGLVHALRVWVADRAVLETARRAAWQHGEERYNWDRERQQFLDVVRRALAARSDVRVRLADRVSAGVPTAAPQRS